MIGTGSKLRTVLVVGLLGLWPVSCSSENPAENDDQASIQITVMVFDDGIAGVAVSLYQAGAPQAVATTVTDDDGVASFDDLEPGTYEVALSLSTDYDIAEEGEARQSVTANDGRKKHVGFYLIPLVTDIDGNRYRTTKIGEQIWTAENLRVSRFRNGDPIPEVQADEDWKQARIDEAPAWSNYNNDPELGAAYGKLYNNYAAADPRGICPEGWHVPSDDEVKTLERFIGMSVSQVDATGYRGDVAGKLMSTRTYPDPHPRWGTSNEGATNVTGFSVVPLGFRNGWPQNSQNEGLFQYLGVEAEFYTTTPYNSGHLARGFVGDERIWRGYGYGHGLGVRCLKN